MRSTTMVLVAFTALVGLAALESVWERVVLVAPRAEFDIDPHIHVTVESVRGAEFSTAGHAAAPGR